jgi:hypothetical protein
MRVVVDDVAGDICDGLTGDGELRVGGGRGQQHQRVPQQRRRGGGVRRQQRRQQPGVYSRPLIGST